MCRTLSFTPGTGRLGMRRATGRGSTDPSVQGPGVPWAGLRHLSPGRDVSGEGGTLIGIHELGRSRYVFPLGLVCSSCNRSGKWAGKQSLEQRHRACHSSKSQCARAETGTSGRSPEHSHPPMLSPPPSKPQHPPSPVRRSFHGGHGRHSDASPLPPFEEHITRRSQQRTRRSLASPSLVSP